MAYNILLSVGRIQNFSIFDYGDRVPLALSANITTMLFTHPVNFPNNFLIQSGRVDLIQVMGITPLELEMAKKTSFQELTLKLINITGGLITDKERSCVI